MSGELGILNVGDGDTKLSFDKSNPLELERAKRIVTDMLRRGYAILVEVSKDDKGEVLYRRAHGFDPETCEYIIAGAPDDFQAEPGRPDDSDIKANANPKSKRRRRVKADRVNAISVGRTAGG